MDPEIDLRRLREIPDPFLSDAASVPTQATSAGGAPSPIRSAIRRQRWAAVVLALGYEAALVLFAGLRADLSGRSAIALALGLGAPLVAAGLALATAQRTGPLGVGGAGSRVALLLLVPLGIFTLAVLASTHPTSGPAGRELWTATAMCIVGTAALAVGPLALATLAFRRAFAAAAAWRTAALGVACGALAAAAIDLRCAIDGSLHILVGHGSAMALGGLAGLALARFTRA